MSRLFLFLCIFILSSCTMLGNYRKSHTQSTSLVQFLYPDGKLPLTDKVNPVLNLPLRVGLAFIPDKVNNTVISVVTKNQLLENVKVVFESREYVAEITIIPELYLHGSRGYSTLNQIKTLYQLDVVALVSYDQVLNSQESLLGLSYLTIVGAYIFRGTGYNVNTLMDLAVVDVDSQSILFRAAGMSTSKDKHIAYAYHKKAFHEKQNKEFEVAMGQMQGNLVLELDKFEHRLRNRDESEPIEVNYRKGYSGGSVSLLLLGLLFMFAVAKYSREDKSI